MPKAVLGIKICFWRKPRLPLPTLSLQTILSGRGEKQTIKQITLTVKEDYEACEQGVGHSKMGENLLQMHSLLVCGGDAGRKEPQEGRPQIRKQSRSGRTEGGSVWLRWSKREDGDVMGIWRLSKRAFILFNVQIVHCVRLYYVSSNGRFPFSKITVLLKEGRPSREMHRGERICEEVAATMRKREKGGGWCRDGDCWAAVTAEKKSGARGFAFTDTPCECQILWVDAVFFFFFFFFFY